MSTPSSMILRSLRLLGEKEIAASLTANEQVAYLADLNTMLESWSLERLMVYQILQENFSLVAGTVAYTIGSGGTFNTARPTKITKAFVRDADSYDSDLRVIEPLEYDDIVSKSTGNTYPTYLTYDAAFVAGLATIKVYPAPAASLTLYIDSWKQLQIFTTISETVVLPPGYQRAIEFNFAIEISAGFKPVPAEIIKIAADSKRAIKGVNLPSSVLRTDGASTSRSSILTGP